MILDLPRKGESPRIHHPPCKSREVPRLLRYRHELVRMRTRVKNGPQALAYGAGNHYLCVAMGRMGEGGSEGRLAEAEGLILEAKTLFIRHYGERHSATITADGGLADRARAGRPGARGGHP